MGGGEREEVGEGILGNNVGLVVDAADVDVIKDWNEISNCDEKTQ